MPDPQRRLYWDSSVFLSYVNDEPGRADIIEELLEQASRDDIEIPRRSDETRPPSRRPPGGPLSRLRGAHRRGAGARGGSVEFDVVLAAVCAAGC
jgi:hypothetical protein